MAYMKDNTGRRLDSISIPSKDELAAPTFGGWYLKARHGLFVHYVWGGTGQTKTIYRNGTVAPTLDQFANDFDVARFAADVKAMGAEYVVFTAYHYAMYALYPSAAMNAVLTGHSTTSKDLIADVIAALKPHGVKFMLYVHPTDGHDLTVDEQTASGWNDSTNSYATWQNFINNLITEIGLRYGTDLDGLWFDMVQAPEFTARFTDLARLKRSMLAGNPDRALIANQGDVDTQYTDYDQAKPFTFRTREYIAAPADVTLWTANVNNNAALAVNTDWFAQRAQGAGNTLKYTAEQMLKMTVFNAGSNRYGGGMMWAAGPYAGVGATSMWEDNVREGLVGLDDLIDPIRESLENVLPSLSYPIASTTTFAGLGTPGFVATRSPDNEKTYIHIVTPPSSGKSINIGLPADGVNFTSGYNLRTGRAVTVQPISTGFTLTLDAADTWDTLDTVIVLNRRTRYDETVFVPAKDFTNTGGGATFSGAALNGRWASWNQTYTATTQIECNYAVPDDWNSYRVEWMYITAGGTAGAIMSFSLAQIAPGSAGNADSASAGQNFPLGTIGVLNVLAPFGPIAVQKGGLQHFRLSRTGNSIGAANTHTIGLLLRKLS